MTEKFSLQRSRELVQLAEEARTYRTKPGHCEAGYRLPANGYGPCTTCGALMSESCRRAGETPETYFSVRRYEVADQLRAALAVIQKQREALYHLSLNVTVDTKEN